jgi:hypothetical protein
MISEVSTSHKPTQMVWGSIWIDRCGRAQRSRLVIMERDLDAPRRGYSTQGYIKALRKGLLPYWRHTQLFMQDNASIVHHAQFWLSLLNTILLQSLGHQTLQVSNQLSTSGGISRSTCSSIIQNTTTSVGLKRSEMAFVRL